MKKLNLQNANAHSKMAINNPYNTNGVVKSHTANDKVNQMSNMIDNLLQST